jgi:hypothetical protein
MDLSDPNPATTVTTDSSQAVRLLTTLFDKSDLVLFRPIETWTEGGTKRSRVDYRHVCYRRALETSLPQTLDRLLKSAVEEHTNLFFGVCPRLGDKGRFDLAWQIRTVRCLWADIDTCTVDDVVARCRQKEVPEPTAIVNSGHGVHLYWLLRQPFVIHDAGDPSPVETEWSLTADGRKKPRRFIVDGEDRIYLDQRRHLSRISPQAQRMQDIVAGIADALGGDHTTDLSRLLRLPGTLNRKDQRNGREPTLARLVRCDPARRYDVDAFGRFAQASRESERQSQVAAMPLPTPRKLTPTKADKLAELIAACAIVPPGARSETDFAVCCYALRHGIAADEVWSRVAAVGKFAERGRKYFDVTWENAAYDVRASQFEKIRRRTVALVTPPRPTELAESQGLEHTTRPVIHIDSRVTPVADTMGQMTEHLLRAGNCFNRIDQLVVVRDQTISPILSSHELAGLLNQHAECYFLDDDGGEYKPLPSAYGNTWLNNVDQRVRFPTLSLFTHNPVYTDDWRLVTPGFDRESGIYYAGPSIVPREGTEHLDTLLRDFCFKCPADRTNYIGLLLTSLLVSRFIGSKPAALFNGNQPELGKSVLAQVVAILRDGQSVETATYNPNDEKSEKRLGSIVRRGVTTIVIDNAKARGRNPRIDSACLERSITDPILSFRLLGFSQEIRAENSHLFCITANTPEVSRDLITRCVVINLYHEGDPKRRLFSIEDPEGFAQQNRLELLGELVGMVERWKSAGSPLARVHTRFNKKGWGNIVGGILAVCGEPDFLANAEEAAAAMDETRREFSELVAILTTQERATWTADQLTDLASDHFLLRSELGDGTKRSQSTRLGVLAGRYVGEAFELGEDTVARFQRSDDGRKSLYYVVVESFVADV